MEFQEPLLMIIDANSLAHRVFHALPPLTTKNGRLVNAIYGFFSIFFKALRDLKPSLVVTAFDSPGPTFRHKIFSDYKATRPKTPEPFLQQLSQIKEILAMMTIKIFEKPGLEADDIIGSVALAAQKSQPPAPEVIILSSDADLLQLVSEKTKVLILKKGISETVLYDEEMVQKRYQGLTPKQLIDFKALRGDPSDNIPGVFGVGEKTAISLIGRFQTLENLYFSLGQKDVKKSLKSSVFDKLVAQKEKAFLSQSLARIRCDEELGFSLEECLWQGYDKKKLSAVFSELEFFSLISRLP